VDKKIPNTYDGRLFLQLADLCAQCLQQLIHLMVLFRLAGEGKIAGEQDQIPGAAFGLQLRQLFEKQLLCLGPEPLLSALPRVKVRDVQPVQLHSGIRFEVFGETSSRASRSIVFLRSRSVGRCAWIWPGRTYNSH
jgi:hypothetical protein